MFTKYLPSWVRSHPVLTGVCTVLFIFVLSIGIALSSGTTRSEYALQLTSNSTVGSAAMPMYAAEEAADYDMANDGSSREKMMAPVPSMGETAGPTAAEATQRLIKTGTMSIVVDDINAAMPAITDYVKSIAGFTEMSSSSEDRLGNRYGNMRVRVPVDSFEPAMAHLRTVAVRVTNEQSEGQDVTEQYTDLEARLRNAKSQEEAYLAVLAKAKSVEEILSVQSYLSNVRYQIESLEGQLKFMDNRTSYSTISITLSEEATVKAPTKDFAPLVAIKNAVQTLIAAFQGIAIAIIWTVIVGIGIALPIALIGWVIYRLIRRGKRRK